MPHRFAGLALLVLLLAGSTGLPPVRAQEIPTPPEMNDSRGYDPGILDEDLPSDEPATLGLPDEWVANDPLQARSEVTAGHSLPEEDRFDIDAVSPLCPPPSTPLPWPELPAPRVCQNRVRSSFKPLGYWEPNPRYFARQDGKPALFFGVSADNGCHLQLDSTVCNRDNYRFVICDAYRRNLDKIRLWVETASDSEPSNHPFAYEDGLYVLDKQNVAYFDNLRKVVELAKRLNMIVEITFLAPWGNDAKFRLGPWGPNRAKLVGGALLPGFTDRRNFVMPDAVRNPMLEHQKRVIEWTLYELWCYDNVYWEIANEPEHASVDPLYVNAWQNALIGKVRTLEESAAYVARGLQAPHLIAVNPFTAAGVQYFKNDSRVAIIAGHYSKILTNPAATYPDSRSSRLDRGAIDQVRIDGTIRKIFEFNEGKISGDTGPTGKFRQFYTRRYQSDTSATYGGPEAARAEGWEFLLGRGASFDHFGYNYSTAEGSAIRDQVARIKTLLSKTTAPATSPDIFSLVPSAFAGPAWIQNPAPYPTPSSGFDTFLNSQRYWAAMETPGFATTATGRKFLLYVHRSAPRCSPSNAADPSYTASRCASYLTFGGYDARKFSNRFRETLTLKLGNVSGSFLVEWIDPITGALAATSTSTTLEWDAASASCSSGRCSVTSPMYDFDILLRVTQR